MREERYRSKNGEKDVLENFSKFTGKHLFRSLTTSLKKRLWQRCFPVNFAIGNLFYITTPLAVSENVQK